jgi:hypothetical protein
MGDSIEASVTQLLRRTLAGGAVLVQELEGIERRAWLAIANASRTQPCVSRVCRCRGIVILWPKLPGPVSACGGDS